MVLSRRYHQSAVRLAESGEDKPTVGPEGGGGGSTDPASAAAADAAATPPAAAKEYSYPELTADAAKHKAGLQDPDVPSWQNPLHHNNPDLQKTFPEDFATREEFEASILPAPPVATPDNPGAAPSHILELAEEIVQLNMLEMSELVNKIADHYGFHEGMLSPDGSGGGGDGGADGLDGDDGAAAAAPAAEKTAWDIRLVAYQDSTKIKVIKEVRSLAGLGLKEAKELVEGAPKVVLKQVKKEDADAIKAKLEELGATVELS
jgi:large subunit ribosomal protein L7/L12